MLSGKEFIHEQLQLQDITPENIAQLTKRVDGLRVGIPLFLVTLKKTPANKEIYHVTNLDKMSVSAENYRGRGKGPSQCHRCQRFRHSSQGCTHDPRCVKCAKQHLTKECDRKEDDPLKCANCNEQHVASFRGCSAFQEEINKLNIKGKGAKGPKQMKPFRNTIYENRTYATALIEEKTALIEQKTAASIKATDQKINQAKELAEKLTMLIAMSQDVVKSLTNINNQENTNINNE